MKMLKRRITSILFIATLLSGCPAEFVQLKIEGQIPEPIIRLEKKLTVSQFHIHKIVHKKGEGNSYQKIEYWGAFAKGIDDEKYLSEIVYGHIPDGYLEEPSAKPLDVGYYTIMVSGGGVTEAGGVFFVLRKREGGLSVMSIGNPYRYEKEFFFCVDDALFVEEDVLSKCLNDKFLKK